MSDKKSNIISVSERDWQSHPPFLYPEYKSTSLRGPTKPLVPIASSLAELTGPVYGHESVGELDHDLTRNAARNGEPIGERIIVTGRVTDDAGRPIPDTLIEIWQANSAGRYIHRGEIHDAPLDPNFLGAGRAVTDANGEYRFVTIKPGAYPWPNHHNAWRPAHIHFSFFGQSFSSRLVSQLYFEGDPTFEYDPIFLSTPEHARDRLIAKFSMEKTEPEWAHAYVWDVVLRGSKGTPMEDER